MNKYTDENVASLTVFQKRMLDTIEGAPNMQQNTWEVARNGFAKEWNEKRSGHGALFRNIVNAGKVMLDKGLIVILLPRDQHDTYTFCSLKKLKDEKND